MCPKYPLHRSLDTWADWQQITTSLTKAYKVPSPICQSLPMGIGQDHSILSSMETKWPCSFKENYIPRYDLKGLWNWQGGFCKLIQSRTRMWGIRLFGASQPKEPNDDNDDDETLKTCQLTIQTFVTF